MRILCSNDSSRAFVAFASKHPDSVGWLQGPSYWKQPRPGIPYALDNDAYTAWTSGHPWSEPHWLAMLSKAKASGIAPLWVLVPDVVADRAGTLASWRRYAPVAASYGWPLAFAVQDGMTPADVPAEASVVFVGGTTRWKWRSAESWCRSFPRVHIGRVRLLKLQSCEAMGAESVDGSGFMRESFDGKPALFLRRFVEGHRVPELPLWGGRLQKKLLD